MGIQMLEKELKAYQKALPELTADEGKFVVIKDDEVAGVFDTYEDALKVGYSKFGLDPFLVKQISQGERILSFSRDYEFACQA